MPNAAAVIDGCRMIKSPEELALMAQAKAMTLEVHRRAARILREGITTTEVRRFIDQAHRALGADDGSSFCAVQFGEASAYPHGLPGEQALADGDLVLIDTGCRVQGYNPTSPGPTCSGPPPRSRPASEAVGEEAQAAARLRGGEAGWPARRSTPSAAACWPRGLQRRLQTCPGLPHRTGHGIGLSIHEAPYLVRGDKTRCAGDVLLNEPMIVIPGPLRHPPGGPLSTSPRTGRRGSPSRRRAWRSRSAEALGSGDAQARSARRRSPKALSAREALPACVSLADRL
jgi:Xaa-Pro dipeptidase